MQSLVAFACLLAVASAGYINNVAPVAVANGRVAYNAPLVNAPHPVPVAHAYAGPIAAPIAHAYAAPVAHAYAAPFAVAAPAVALASEARLVDPVAVAAGAPLPTGDTVEVAAAKAAHFAAHAAAKSQAYAAPVAAVAPVAHAYAAPISHAYAAPAVALASEARLVDPVAIAAGAPLPTGDTVEVAAAKAAHFAAHAAAKGHIIAKRSPGYLGAAAYAAPLAYSAYAAPIAHAYTSHIVTPFAHTYAKTHLIGKRSPGYLGAAAYAAPLAYSAYAGPYAYSAYNGYAYGHLGAIYG